MTSSWSATSLEDNYLNLVMNTTLNYSSKKKSQTPGLHEYKLWIEKSQTKNKKTPAPHEYKLRTAKSKTNIKLLTRKSINYEWQNH